MIGLIFLIVGVLLVGSAVIWGRHMEDELVVTLLVHGLVSLGMWYSLNFILKPEEIHLPRLYFLDRDCCPGKSE
jgi:hypothetical protein